MLEPEAYWCCMGSPHVILKTDFGGIGFVAFRTRNNFNFLQNEQLGYKNKTTK